jgi:ABC-type transport system substrate-binding protein
MTRDDGSETDEQSSVSRRRMLQGLSVGAAGALAGCQGGDGGGTSTTTTTTTATDTTTSGTTATSTTTSEGTTETTTTEETTEESTTTESMGEAQMSTVNIPMSMDNTPPQQQFNTYNHKGGAAPTLWDNLGGTHFGKPNSIYHPILCEDITVDMQNGVIEYNLKDSKWWRPGPRYVNGEDVQMMVYGEIGVRGRDAFKNTRSIKVTDDRTLTLKMREPMNPDIARRQAMVRGMKQCPEYWGQWRDSVRGARKADGTWDSQELEAIQQDMLNWELDEPNGNSILQIESINPDAFVCSVNEGHMHADRWNGVEEIRVTMDSNQQRRVQKFLQGDLNVPNSKEIPLSARESIDFSHEVLRFPNESGASLGFQMRTADQLAKVEQMQTEPFSTNEARRAAMFIMDQYKLAENIKAQHGSDTIPDETFTGITAAEDQYIPSEMQSKYPNYEKNLDAAHNLLSSVEGLTMPQGSDYFHWNEKVWEPLITAQNSGSRKTFGQVVTDQLDQGGIKGNLQITDSGKLWGDMYTNNTFGLFPGATYGGWGVYPYNGLTADAIEGGYAGRFGYSGACNFEGQTQAPEFNTEWDPTVPDSEHSMETYELCQMMEDLKFATDKETADRIIQRISWAYSHNVSFGGSHYANNVSVWSTRNYTFQDMEEGDISHWDIARPRNELITLGKFHPELQ